MRSHIYNYVIKRALVQQCEDINRYHHIHCVCYSVNTTSISPFLQFLLSNSHSEELQFPSLSIVSSITESNVVDYIKVYLSGLLKADDFETFSSSLIVDGFFMENDALYIFIDMTNSPTHLSETYIHDPELRSPVRYGLLDEIIERRHVCGIPVSTATTGFFLTHVLATQLYNVRLDKTYETPIVAYVGKTIPGQLNFVSVFGENAKNRSGMMGPYYYFTDFANAFRQGGWCYPENKFGQLMTTAQPEKCLKGGVVRFALFMGATKYVENLPNDPVDSSATKQARLLDPQLNPVYELSTIKISDHDGQWSHQFDSVYVGRLEVERGLYVEDSPMYVIKDVRYQIPLSYHMIDVRTLGETFDYFSTDYKLV